MEGNTSEQAFFRSGDKSILPKWLFVTLIASGFIIIMWVVGLGVYISHSNTITRIHPEKTMLTSVTRIETNASALAPTPLVIFPSPAPVEWKKYKAAQYSISYPPDWTLKEFTGNNAVQIYNPKTAHDAHNPRKIGPALASQFVLITTIATTLTPSQYVDGIQLGCCTGPSPTASMSSQFQKQSVTLNHQGGLAYTPATNSFKNWDIVYAVNNSLLDLASSIESTAGNSVENQILNTLKLNPQ